MNYFKCWTSCLSNSSELPYFLSHSLSLFSPPRLALHSVSFSLSLFALCFSLKTGARCGHNRILNVTLLCFYYFFNHVPKGKTTCQRNLYLLTLSHKLSSLGLVNGKRPWLWFIRPLCHLPGSLPSRISILSALPNTGYGFSVDYNSLLPESLPTWSDWGNLRFGVEDPKVYCP